MTDPSPSLYDELGVPMDAPEDVLRAAYRRRARQLHPDVAAEATSGDAMRRLNEAWAILGDPEQRRRYDQSQTAAPPLPQSAGATGGATSAPGTGATASDEYAGPAGRRLPYLRPSAWALVILAGLFIVTAYAGSWPGNSTTQPGSTPPTTGADSLTGAPARTVASAGISSGEVIGRCLTDRGGQVAIVVCSVLNDGQILAAVPASGECPAGTTGHLWLPSTLLCAVATTRPGSP